MITTTPAPAVKTKAFTAADARSLFTGCRPDVALALDGIGIASRDYQEAQTRAYLAAFFVSDERAMQAWAETLVREVTAVLDAKATPKPTPRPFTATTPEDDAADMADLMDDGWVTRTSARPFPALRNVDPDEVEDAELADIQATRPGFHPY